MNNDRMAWISILAALLGMGGGVAGTTAVNSISNNAPIVQQHQTIDDKFIDDLDVRMHNMETSVNHIVQYIVDKEKQSPQLPLKKFPVIPNVAPNNGSNTGSKVGDTKE